MCRTHTRSHTRSFTTYGNLSLNSSSFGKQKFKTWAYMFDSASSLSQNNETEIRAGKPFQ